MNKQKNGSHLTKRATPRRAHDDLDTPNKLLVRPRRALAL